MVPVSDLSLAPQVHRRDQSFDDLEEAIAQPLGFEVRKNDRIPFGSLAKSECGE
jgi:hypothetical protein